jgi:hypothetical protein
MQGPAAADHSSDEMRSVRSSVQLTIVICAFGLLARWHLYHVGLIQPDKSNIFFRQFGLFEFPHLIALGLFAVATLFALRRPSQSASVTSARQTTLGPLSSRRVAIVSFIVLLVGIATTYLVMHGLLFSMDEFTTDFQARLLARGQYFASLPPIWRPFGGSLAPIFVNFDSTTGRWMSQYLPVYSVIKAPFVWVGIPTFLNPILSASSVLVLAAVARRLWPGEELRPWAAIALFATSSEVIVTSGSGYSMPAHLLLNLLWLWLYLRGDNWSWACALFIGVLALGLHNPFPHALFVAPFLLRTLRERRWGRVASAAIVYVAGAAVWLAWFRLSAPFTRGEEGVTSLFALPGPAALALHTMNVALLFTWHAPAFGILVLVAIAHPRRLPPFLADLAASVAVTLVFYTFFESTQGHGWGYRYAYQIIGNLSLLAAAGLPTLCSVFGEVRARRWLTVALAVAIFGQIPLRLWQTERFVRPFAAGNDYISSQDADVVLVHGDSLWYGRDLVRNDPFLRRPVVVRANKLSAESTNKLLTEFPGRVVDVPDSALAALGMTLMPAVDDRGRASGAKSSPR